MTVSSPCPRCGGGNPLDGEDPVCRCGSQWGRDAAKKGGLTRTKGLSPGKGLAAGKGFGTRKPMKAGKGLARATTPTPSSTPMPRRTPARRPPNKPRVADDVRAVVLARSGGRCEVAADPACRARGRSLTSVVGASQHHRLPGRMGGSKRASVHQATNLLQVCGSGTTGCHGWIESNRTVSLCNGWLLHGRENPETRPVLLHDGRRVVLTADGGYRPLGASTESTLPA